MLHVLSILLFRLLKDGIFTMILIIPGIEIVLNFVYSKPVPEMS